MIYVNSQASAKEDDKFTTDYLPFYLVNAVLNFTAVLMFFAERKNPLAKFVNSKTSIANKNKPPVKIRAKVVELFGSFKKAWVTLLYLALLYIETFLVFPGVSNYTDLTFLKKGSQW